MGTFGTNSIYVAWNKTKINNNLINLSLLIGILECLCLVTLSQCKMKMHFVHETETCFSPVKKVPFHFILLFLSFKCL